MQVFDVALLEVGFPRWSLVLAVWLVFILLPVIVLVSWRYDFSLSGIKRTPPSAQQNDADLSLKPIDNLAITLILVFVVGVSLLLTRSLSTGQDSAGTTKAALNSIAVLPFQNMTGRPEDAYLAEGLSEDILHRLAVIRGLSVASRTASFELDVSNLAMSEIGQRLGVEYVLEGSVRKDDNRLRIVTQLIDAGSGYHLWSRSYDREMRDLFGIYDEISNAVAGELRLTLSPQSLMAPAPTSDMEAYDYFLQARSMLRPDKHHYDAFRKARSLNQGDTQAADFYMQAQSLHQQSSGAESASSAYRFFAKAVERDPAFALAWAGQCQAMLDWYWYQPELQKIEQAETSCLKALELDPGLSAGHVALGDLYRKTGQLDSAIDEYRSALDGDGDNAAAWLGLGGAFAAQELDSDAEHAMNRAIDIDPDDLRSYYALGAFLFRNARYQDASSVYRTLASHVSADASSYNGLAISYYMNGDFASAAEAYRQVISTHPTAVAYNNVGTQYFYSSQFEDAVVMYRQAIALGPTNPVWWGNLADAQRQLDGGRAASEEAYRKAAELAAEMLQANPGDVDNLTNLAHYHARLGDDRQAMQYLAKALTAAPNDYYAFYYAALVHLEAGRRQEALDAIRRSVELGYPRHMLGVDVQFEIFHDNEIFLGLIDRPAHLTDQ